MNLKIVSEQLILFVGVFLLVNTLIFIPNHYDLCLSDSSENSSFEDPCSQILQLWKSSLEPPLTVRYHFVPMAAALIVSLPLLVYRIFELEYESKGVQNWDERER